MDDNCLETRLDFLYAALAQQYRGPVESVIEEKVTLAEGQLMSSWLTTMDRLCAVFYQML